MTTTRHTPTHTETSPDTAPRDLRRTWRWLAAAALVLGPLGVTAIRAVMPYWTDDTPAEMARWVDQVGADACRGAHPVLPSAYAHDAFVCGHPVADGNGIRVARHGRGLSVAWC